MCIVPRAIVDSHHHLWSLGHARHPWLQDGYDPQAFILGEYEALRRDFGVREFRASWDGQPVVASVHVEAECERGQALAETRWLHELHATYGLPNAVVAWVDLLAPDADERLAEQAAFALVRGIRCKPLAVPAALCDARWLAAPMWYCAFRFATCRVSCSAFARPGAAAGACAPGVAGP